MDLEAKSINNERGDTSSSLRSDLTNIPDNTRIEMLKSVSGNGGSANGYKFPGLQIVSFTAEDRLHIAEQQERMQTLALNTRTIERPLTPNVVSDRTIALNSTGNIVDDYNKLLEKQAREHGLPSHKEDKSANAMSLLSHIKASQDAKERALVETSFDKKLLDMTNQYRARNHLPPLEFDPALKLAAGVSADAQCRLGLSHNTDVPGWITPQQRIKKVGRTPPNGYLENAAMGMRDPKAILNAWQNSDGHNRALLNGNANLVGISRAQAKNGTYYTTLVLGRGKAVDQSILPKS